MKNKLFFHDFLILAVSIILAVLLVKTGVLSQLLISTGHGQYLGSFVAGLFFTSVFTTAPAIVALGQIAALNTIILTAFFGAIGSTIGDVIMFRFIRDRFSEHLLEVVSHNTTTKRVGAIFRRRSFRLFTFFVGGMIIASPLPDELGIGLLGMSHLKMRRFVPISFVCNFIGIVLIGLAARAL
ncbi:MAG: hypothetical protein AAB391_03425 [Patescibacteria group bacterium]